MALVKRGSSTPRRHARLPLPAQAGDGHAEERLLIEAAQKDPARFGELYEIHFELVYAYIARRVRDRDAAEDLTSEVFHQALANLGRFEWRGAPFAAWLVRIAANAIADRWKRGARERGNPAPEKAASAEESPDRAAERGAMFRLVGTLPEDQRRVIYARFVTQRSIREIAQALRRSEGAVKQLQFRALQNLRTRMSERHG